MRTFRTISCAALIFLSGAAAGQGLDDALLFSRQHMHGSARFNAMGGAFTALGGDMGAIHLNPASTGVFTKNELGITLGVGNTGIHSGYYGNPVSSNYGKINANSIGILFVSEINHPDWKSINVGITYARTHDFNERMSYSGSQNQHSFGQHIANQANSLELLPEDLGNADPFVIFPAYSAYIIDNTPNSDVEYYSPVEGSESVRQELDRQRDGRGSEWMLSVGSNYKDRLYFGLGLHVNTMVLTERLDHLEVPENNEMITRHSYRSDYELRGTSYSLSGGFIARLSNMFRVGASVQTPNFYVNNEVFSTTFRASLQGAYAEYAAGFDASNPTVATSPQGSFRYNFNTPWRFTGGVAAVFGPRAILSAEYEYKDYSTASFGRNNRSASSYDFGVENDDIGLVLGQTHNVRAGFEYRILPYSLRVGYAFFQDPVSSEFRGDTDRNIHQLSAGAGVRFKKIYLDAGYFYRMSNSRYRLYNTGNNDAATLAIAQHGFSLTFGIRY